jgi:hypothetical protein
MPRGRVAAAAAAAPVSVAVAGAAAGVPQVKGLAGSAAPDVLGYFKRLYGLQFWELLIQRTRNAFLIVRLCRDFGLQRILVSSGWYGLGAQSSWSAANAWNMVSARQERSCWPMQVNACRNACACVDQTYFVDCNENHTCRRRTDARQNEHACAQSEYRFVRSDSRIRRRRMGDHRNA